MEVAASIAGLLAVGAQVTFILKQFISSTTSAPVLAQTLQSEIEGFSFVLTRLQSIILGSVPFNRSRLSLIETQHISLTITACVCTFSELERETSRLNPWGKIGFWYRLRWAKAEPALNSIVQRLQNDKLSLTLMLTILTCTSLQVAEDCRRSLDENVQCALISAQLGSTSSNFSNEHENAIPSTAVSPESDEVSSVHTISTVPSRLALYQLAFESALFVSRPYKRARNMSGISLGSWQRPRPRWSLYTGNSSHSVLSLPVSLQEESRINLADLENMSSIELPMSPELLYNTKWYQPGGKNRPLPIPACIKLNLTECRALKLAVKDGYEPGVRKILDRENLVPVSYYPRHLIHTAIESGKLPIVRLLLQRSGFDCTTVIDVAGTTPLGKAAALGNIEICELLWDWSRCTPLESIATLYRVVKGQNESRIQALRQRVNIVDKNGNTALHIATSQEKWNDVGVLLRLGADQNARNRDNSAPLHLATRCVHEPHVRCRHELIVQQLLKFDADPNSRDDVGDTPLHNAAIYGRVAIVELLLSAGADKEAKNMKHKTPLHTAAVHNRSDVIRVLVQQGEGMENYDVNGKTPLHCAACEGQKSAVEVLLLSGAKLEIRDKNGRGALHEAARLGHSSIVELLLKGDCSTEMRGKEGRTPLHHAALQGRENVVRLLLAYRAERGAEDNINCTPLQLAVASGYQEIVQILNQGGEKRSRCNVDPTTFDCADSCRPSRGPQTSLGSEVTGNTGAILH